MSESILVAVALQRFADITPRALAVRSVAVDMARLYDAPLTALTVHVQLALMPEGESTEQKMARFVAPLLEQGVRVESMVREGSPRVVISEVAGEIGARLVVLGTHSKRGILDTPVGGTAKAVISGAPCRVILVATTAEESQKTRELIIPEYPFIFPYG
ncbi:MAG: universal stress protein [Nitrospinota bacterium]